MVNTLTGAADTSSAVAVVVGNCLKLVVPATTKLPFNEMSPRDQMVLWTSKFPATSAFKLSDTSPQTLSLPITSMSALAVISLVTNNLCPT